MNNELMIQTLIKQSLDAFTYYFKEEFMKRKNIHASKFNIVNVSVKEKEGTVGSLFIVTVTLQHDKELMKIVLALKFVEDNKTVKKELKNALLLEHKFRTFPKYNIPKVIFSSTNNPSLIVYEGVIGINYDEITDLPQKPYEAGRLLAIIHGTELHKLPPNHYRHYIQKLTETLRDIPYERELMKLVNPSLENILSNHEGAPIYADFHQSNVMINYKNNQVFKTYVIDPEWYDPHEIYSRFEDIGTFFGRQAFLEWRKTNAYTQVTKDLLLFFNGYQDQLKEMNGSTFKQMINESISLEFYIALWALLDSLDVLALPNQEQALKEHQERKQFALDILKKQPFSDLLTKRFLK